MVKWRCVLYFFGGDSGGRTCWFWGRVEARKNRDINIGVYHSLVVNEVVVSERYCYCYQVFQRVDSGYLVVNHRIPSRFYHCFAQSVYLILQSYIFTSHNHFSKTQPWVRRSPTPWMLLQYRFCRCWKSILGRREGYIYPADWNSSAPTHLRMRVRVITISRSIG